MQKNKLKKLIPAAINAIIEAGIVENARVEKTYKGYISSIPTLPVLISDQKVEKTYKGYISSMGASIITAGILPTMIFFSDKGDSKADRSKIIEALAHLVMSQDKKTKKDLLQKVLDHVKNNRESELRRFTDEILLAATAIKLAIRIYPEK